MTDDEEWRPILGIAGDYSISESGVVRNNRTGRIRKPSVHRQGYLKHTFRLDGRLLQKYVHRMVAEAFLPPSSDPFVRHIDDDKTNNHHSNLIWGMPRDNTRDAIRNGLITPSFKDGFCTLAGHPQEGNDIGDKSTSHNCAECRRVWDRQYRKRRNQR